MPRKNLVAGASLMALVFGALSWAQAPQDKSQRPSPPATAECTIKGKKVTISYSRPSKKGRKVMEIGRAHV